MEQKAQKNTQNTFNKIEKREYVSRKSKNSEKDILENSFMNRLRSTKKAVSPLIATVLLIAFAVALGAVVMNWGRGYVEDTAQFATEVSGREVSCSTAVTLEILKIGGKTQICVDNGTDTINFTIQNSGSLEVKGIRVQAIGNTSSIAMFEMNETFQTALPKRRHMNYSFSGNGTVAQVRFTPLIEVNEKKVWCAQNVLKIETVNICS